MRKVFILGVFLLIALVAMSPAMADRVGHSGGHFRGGHDGHFRGGHFEHFGVHPRVFIGGGFYGYPYWAYPYPYPYTYYPAYPPPDAYAQPCAYPPPSADGPGADNNAYDDGSGTLTGPGC